MNIYAAAALNAGAGGLLLALAVIAFELRARPPKPPTDYALVEQLPNYAEVTG